MMNPEQTKTLAKIVTAASEVRKAHESTQDPDKRHALWTAYTLLMDTACDYHEACNEEAAA